MPDSTTVPRRRNGFSRPYSGAQIAAWIALGVTFVEFPIVVSPLMPFVYSAPVTAVFYLLLFLVVFFGGKTLLINPMDIYLARSLKEQRRPQEQQQQEGGKPKKEKKSSTTMGCLYNLCNPDRTAPYPDEPMKQCWICDLQVAEHSMHCKFCNKCVSHFDHHCMWLNTCIGEANYEPFFKTMVFIFAMEIYHFSIQLVLLVDSWTNGPTRSRTDSWFSYDDMDYSDSSGHVVGIHATLTCFLVFNAVSIFLLGQLLWFHLGLQKEKLTTYQYIVRDHRRKRDRIQREEALDAQRIQELVRARDEGNTCRIWHLRCGGCCRNTCGMPCLDPLVVPPPEPSIVEAGNTQDQRPATAASATTATTRTPSAAGSGHMSRPPQQQQQPQASQTSHVNGGDNSRRTTSNNNNNNISSATAALHQYQSNGSSQASTLPKPHVIFDSVNTIPQSPAIANHNDEFMDEVDKDKEILQTPDSEESKTADNDEKAPE